MNEQYNEILLRDSLTSICLSLFAANSISRGLYSCDLVLGVRMEMARSGSVMREFLPSSDCNQVVKEMY